MVTGQPRYCTSGRAVSSVNVAIADRQRHATCSDCVTMDTGDWGRWGLASHMGLMEPGLTVIVLYRVEETPGFDHHIHVGLYIYVLVDTWK